MVIIKYFLIAFVISAFGSLPIGLITLTIVQKTIEKGKAAGYYVALGASVMEFVYTFIALIGLDYLSIEQEWKQYIQIIAMFVFMSLGFYYWFKSSTPINQKSKTRQGWDFFHGIGIGAMNLLIVPFWIVVGLWLESNGFLLDDLSIIIGFTIGSTIGALLIFIAYIEGSAFILQKSELINVYANKAIGALFLVLGLIQLVQLYL